MNDPEAQAEAAAETTSAATAPTTSEDAVPATAPTTSEDPAPVLVLQNQSSSKKQLLLKDYAFCTNVTAKILAGSRPGLFTFGTSAYDQTTSKFYQMLISCLFTLIIVVDESYFPWNTQVTIGSTFLFGFFTFLYDTYEMFNEKSEWVDEERIFGGNDKEKNVLSRSIYKSKHQCK